jgi:hypothetical protein
MRVQWSDIAKAARETSEALNGKEWVNASIKARILLADMADEVERLTAELAHEREQRDLRHQAYLEGCAQIEAMRIEHDAIANALADDRDRVARERDLALIEAGRQWRPGEWHTDAEWLAIGRTAAGLEDETKP